MLNRATQNRPTVKVHYGKGNYVACKRTTKDKMDFDASFLVQVVEGGETIKEVSYEKSTDAHRAYEAENNAMRMRSMQQLLPVAS